MSDADFEAMAQAKIDKLEARIKELEAALAEELRFTFAEQCQLLMEYGVTWNSRSQAGGS